MQSGRERRGDIDERGFAGHAFHPDGGPATLEPGRHDDIEAGGRRKHDAGGGVADADRWRGRLLDRKSGAFDADAAAFNRSQRMNGSNAGGH